MYIFIYGSDRKWTDGRTVMHDKSFMGNKPWDVPGFLDDQHRGEGAFS